MTLASKRFQTRLSRLAYGLKALWRFVWREPVFPLHIQRAPCFSRKAADDPVLQHRGWKQDAGLKRKLGLKYYAVATCDYLDYAYAVPVDKEDVGMHDSPRLKLLCLSDADWVELLENWREACRRCGYERFFYLAVVRRPFTREAYLTCPNCGLRERVLEDDN